MTPVDVPNALGVIALLAAATFASEDLTCIAAGVMVAEGRFGFVPAIVGCFAGIVSGDLLIFVAGRFFGARLLALPFARHFISRDTLERNSNWLAARGSIVVLITRFVPGTRVATSAAAGALRVDALTFAAWIAIAAAVWTPLLVGASRLIGAEAARAGLLTAGGIATPLIITGIAVFAAIRLASAALTWRTRRRLYGLWRRAVRWEFWPPWVFYPPVVAWIAWLMVKHRSMTVFTAANPAIDAGGFIGESKFDILRGLSASTNTVAHAALIPGHLPAHEKIAATRRFMSDAGLAFPIVLKPNQGQRGSGVMIVKTLSHLEHQLADAPLDVIVQEYISGLEFGVFYVRHPSQSRGWIFSITEKQFPAVVGDGRRTVDDLILADDRGVCLRAVYRRANAAVLNDVPPAGARVPLVEIGSHCRGSRFVDAAALASPALVEAFDRIARGFEGFYFGRFDVRTPSVEDFRSGTFRILELNGVTSEATHIYDPGMSVWSAWRVLWRQWHLAFEIGAENRKRGCGVAPLSSLVASVLAYRRVARKHPQPRRGQTPMAPELRRGADPAAAGV